MLFARLMVSQHFCAAALQIAELAKMRSHLHLHVPRASAVILKLSFRIASDLTRTAIPFWGRLFFPGSNFWLNDSQSPGFLLQGLEILPVFLASNMALHDRLARPPNLANAADGY
jgi:hypothetical protein